MNEELPCDEFMFFNDLSYQSKILINDRVGYFIFDDSDLNKALADVLKNYTNIKAYIEAVLDLEFSPIWRGDYDDFDSEVESLIINSVYFIALNLKEELKRD